MIRYHRYDFCASTSGLLKMAFWCIYIYLYKHNWCHGVYVFLLFVGPEDCILYIIHHVGVSTTGKCRRGKCFILMPHMMLHYSAAYKTRLWDASAGLRDHMDPSFSSLILRLILFPIGVQSIMSLWRKVSLRCRSDVPTDFKRLP